MSGRYPFRPLRPEDSSDHPESEPGAFAYDWSIPDHTPSLPFGYQDSVDPVLGVGSASGPGNPPEEQSNNAKVPIPRSTNPNIWTSSGRTSRACENCRDQKAKCSGHRPACTRCKDAGLQCIYSYRKREKILKYVGTFPKVR